MTKRDLQSIIVGVSILTTNAQAHEALSLDFGGVQDQQAFVEGVQGQGFENVIVDNKYLYSLNHHSYGEHYKKLAQKNAMRFDEVAKNAEVIHLSGHHKIGTSLIYMTQQVENSGFDAGLDIRYLSEHPQAELVVVNCCFSVAGYFEFTRMLAQKFPNAVIVGYQSKAPVSEMNSRAIEDLLLEDNLLDMTKDEIAKRWLATCEEQWGTTFSRQGRAVWKEEKKLIEYSMFGRREWTLELAKHP